mmetsp:Transcript_14015/g.17661  ORF Transcript_14015/g.17661 Transcript_14015/m.17661 type:complete len:116 (-) Transcript_14015:132-479(-)
MPLSVNLSSIINYIGITLVLHSTYSCLQHREKAITEFEVDVGTYQPPLDVIIEVLLGFCLCLFGQLMAVGPFLEVRATAASKKELMAPPHRTRDFDIYVTRGKVLAMAREKLKGL